MSAKRASSSQARASRVVVITALALSSCGTLGEEHVVEQHFDLDGPFTTIEGPDDGSMEVVFIAEERPRATGIIHYRGRKRPRARVELDEQRLKLVIDCPEGLMECRGRFQLFLPRSSPEPS